MKKILAPRLALLYLILTAACIYLFTRATPLYLNNCEDCTYPIDSRVTNGTDLSQPLHFFDAAYVKYAKENCYLPVEKFYSTFFIIDLIFPLLYTLLFLSLLRRAKQDGFAVFLQTTMLIAMAHDYAENLSFAYYLRQDLEFLPKLIAFFTTIKTVTFGFSVVFISLKFISSFFKQSAGKKPAR